MCHVWFIHADVRIMEFATPCTFTDATITNMLPVLACADRAIRILDPETKKPIYEVVLDDAPLSIAPFNRFNGSLLYVPMFLDLI